MRDYIWADSTPIAMITKDPTTGTETVTYLHTDYDDTPRMATNQSGTILWRWEGVFGDTLPSPNGVDVTVRYPGQTYDSETGLFYNWNRYYDPGTGRYGSSDPIGLRGGLNTYAYGNLNPLQFIDLAGLCFTIKFPIDYYSHSTESWGGPGRWHMTAVDASGGGEDEEIGLPFWTVRCFCSSETTGKRTHTYRIKWRAIVTCMNCGKLSVHTRDYWGDTWTRVSPLSKFKQHFFAWYIINENFADYDCEQKCASLN